MIGNNKIKRNIKPTLKERIFGIPSLDETNSFRNRDVKITTKYENIIKVPEIKIETQSILQDSIYIRHVSILNGDNKDLLLTFFDNWTLDGPTNQTIIADLVGNSVNITPTSLALYPDNYFSLGFNQHMRLYVEFVGAYENYYLFNLSITINNEESFLIASRNSVNLGISKTVKIDKYKNQVESYKPIMSTVLNDFKIEDDNYIYCFICDISFFTQLVTTKTTQTDSEIYIEILSSVGSLISTVALVCGIGFSIITKFFIKEKDGWIDSEVRETIVYHVNQLNEDNLIHTNDCNKEEDDNN
ncbi:hypothetical protein ACTFIU_001687 [Dictyostelium citrinum]